MTVEATAVGQLIVGMDQSIREVNDAYLDLAGRSRADLIGKKAFHFTHDDDRVISQRLLGLLAAGAPPFALVSRYVRADQSVVWVEDHVSLVDLSAGARIICATSRAMQHVPSTDRVAKNYLTARQLCLTLLVGKHIFSPEIVSAPAAEALLWLYRAEVEYRAFTVDQLAEQIGISPRLAVRWVSLLEQRNLVEREQGHAPDASRTLRITREAERSIDDLLVRSRNETGFES